MKFQKSKLDSSSKQRLRLTGRISRIVPSEAAEIESILLIESNLANCAPPCAPDGILALSSHSVSKGLGSLRYTKSSDHDGSPGVTGEGKEGRKAFTSAVAFFGLAQRSILAAFESTSTSPLH